ncbi:MAG: hypothetical protein DRI57_01135 [Deltaproteobacteria bacterium]|nr:MAG: hypothetical protein DRI57_01135 [Deltaproteobacteria bacterium]
MESEYNIDFSKLLQRLANEIKKLSHSDLKRVADGKADIVLQVVKKKQTHSKSVSEPDIEKIGQNIEGMTSREEGMSYLEAHVSTKNKLKLLAKHLEIPIRRTDKRDQIIEKIIESTIGYRLRSAAIQNPESR